MIDSTTKLIDVTTKLEVNFQHKLTSRIDGAHLSQLFVKHRIPSVVVAPHFIEPIVVERMKVNGNYSIICAVDFEKGTTYAMEKLRSLPQCVQAVNGFDILVSSKRTDKESLNELKSIYQFIKSVYGKTVQIRWTLGMLTRKIDEIQNVIPHLISCPANYIRLDNNLVIPGVTEEQHRNAITVLRQFIQTPVKVSGNITYEMAINLKSEAARFDVSIEQFNAIVKNVQKRQVEPKEVSEPGVVVRVKKA